MKENKISTSIILYNDNNKKNISIKSFYDDFVDENNYEIENELKDRVVINFLNSNIISIQYLNTIIDDKNKQCMLLKNKNNCNLIIHSDDINIYFKDLVKYIDDYRNEMIENTIINYICNNKYDEIRFELNYSKRCDCEVKELKQDNKNILVYKIPFSYNKKKKIVINQNDLMIVKNSITNYFQITGDKLISIYPQADQGYSFKLFIYAKETLITINEQKIYEELELYFAMIMKDLEEKNALKNEEVNKVSERNKVRSKLKVIKKDEE